MKVLDDTPDEAATDVAMDGPVEVTDMLTLNDRCDRCIQHAVVRIKVAGGLLDFCKHDFEKAEGGLTAAGAVILHDDRARLAHKPA